MVRPLYVLSHGGEYSYECMFLVSVQNVASSNLSHGYWVVRRPGWGPGLGWRRWFTHLLAEPTAAPRLSTAASCSPPVTVPPCEIRCSLFLAHLINVMLVTVS